jgi:hypothetical protein
MGLGSFCRSICIGLVFGFSLLYGLFFILFRYEYEQTCQGVWGAWSPPLEQKTGKGICH